MSIKKMEENNIKGKLATGAVIAGVTATLALAGVFSNKDTESKTQNKVTVTMNTQDEPIKLEDTKDYKVIKVKDGDYKRINNMWNNSEIKYYIVKEFLFPYSKESKIKNLYALVDITTNKPVLYRNNEGKVIDENFDLKCIELGTLTDYLVKYDYIKEEYKTNELQVNIIEQLEKENHKKEKIDFYDTTQYDILELENKKTEKYSYHIVKKWPNPRGRNNDVYDYSIYQDVENGEYILEVDEFGEVTDEYKKYSYNVLGSLTDYLVTYNSVKPEYDVNEFKNILNKVKQKYNPAEKVK